MKKFVVLAPLAFLGMALFAFLGGEIVKLLWNWLAPALFGGKEITFWQAFGLLALCRILFGRSGLGRRIHRAGAWRGEAGGWKRMTPEEREKWRQTLRERWGCGPPPDSKPTA